MNGIGNQRWLDQLGLGSNAHELAGVSDKREPLRRFALTFLLTLIMLGPLMTYC